MDTFKDFIPEGEDQGAQGAGFSDFVPSLEPIGETTAETTNVVEAIDSKPIEKPPVYVAKKDRKK